MDDKLMSPAASPVGVKRVSKWPLMMVSGVLGLFVVVMACVAYSKGQASTQAPEEAPPRVQGESPAQIARRIVGARGIVPPKVAPRTPQPSAAEPVVLVASVDEGPPRPPGGVATTAHTETSSGPTADVEDARKERLAALRRALSGSTGVQIQRDSAPSSSPRDASLAEIERVRHEREGLSATAADPAAAYQKALKAAQAQALGANAEDATQPSTPPMPAGIGSFNREGSPDRFRLNSELELPPSRFVVQAGAVVPATLDSAINSELPGTVLAHVALDVYDSPTGRHLLVPQGAKLFGEYASNVAFGQSRLMIAWQRITMPDGRTIDIGEMPGADGVGRSGFEDQVDNHLFRLFASALLLSGVTAGVAMSQDPGQNTMRVTAGSAMSQALGQQLGQVTAQLIQKNMNIAPTLDVRPGYRFNIIVTKDIVFHAPYRRNR
jgi:type IV secretion system protein VirB10